MSPGCAARLRAASGATAFVKAVGAALNPDTPMLFRREIAVLARLSPVTHRPRLMGRYDDGEWVAVLLEDVDGRYPDLADPAGPDALAVRAAIERQAAELTPPPSGLDVRTIVDVAQRWLRRWQDIVADPDRFLPAWAAKQTRELHDRVTTVPGRVVVESLCHWDIRDDNLLVRPDGSVVIVDWGMACLGPSWGDLFVLASTWADQPAFDELLAVVDDEIVTDLMLLMGGALAWSGAKPARPGLPNLPAFCRTESGRLFAGAARRLHLDANT